MNNEQPIPENVIAALARVRDSGEANMMDRRTVILLIAAVIDMEAADWLTENPRRYLDALIIMGERAGNG